MNSDDPDDRLFAADVPLDPRRLSGLVWVIAAVVACAIASAVAVFADTWGDFASRLAVGVRIFWIVVSLGAVLLSFGVAVAWLVAAPGSVAAYHRRRRGRRRRKQGLCERCGYDLRASMDRCPECGLLVDEGE